MIDKKISTLSVNQKTAFVWRYVWKANKKKTLNQHPQSICFLLSPIHISYISWQILSTYHFLLLFSNAFTIIPIHRYSIFNGCQTMLFSVSVTYFIWKIFRENLWYCTVENIWFTTLLQPKWKCFVSRNPSVWFISFRPFKFHHSVHQDTLGEIP